METKEVLQKAKKLILDPENWTQGVSARDKDDKSASPNSKAAISWCALGAIAAVDNSAVSHRGAYRKLLDVSGVGYIGSFNDSHSHEEVLDLFDRAISLCKEE